MSELDRILENNQTGMRMKQAQQLLKMAAEVALLAATSGAAGALGKAGAGASKAASAAGGKLLIKKTSDETLKTSLRKGAEGFGKMAFEQGKNKIKKEVTNKIKEQLPDGTLTALERAESLKKSADNTRNILETFKKAAASPTNINGTIDSVAVVLLGKGDLTHGGLESVKKVVEEVKVGTTRLEAINENQKDQVELVKTFFAHDGKTALLVNKTPEEIMKKEFITSAKLTNGKYALEIAQNYSAVASLNKLRVADLQTQLAKGEDRVALVRGQTTADLLKDTKALLEATEKDEEEKEAEERSEEAIKKMLKA